MPRYQIASTWLCILFAKSTLPKRMPLPGIWRISSSGLGVGDLNVLLEVKFDHWCVRVTILQREGTQSHFAQLCCLCDEYANRIPNPKHMPEYTKAKVPRSFTELCCHCHYPIKSLAAACLPEYVATHAQLTA